MTQCCFFLRRAWDAMHKCMKAIVDLWLGIVRYVCYMSSLLGWQHHVWQPQTLEQEKPSRRGFLNWKKRCKKHLTKHTPLSVRMQPENQPPKNGVSSFWTLSNFLGPCCTLRVYLNSKPKLLNLIPARHSQIRKKNQKKSHQRLARQE